MIKLVNVADTTVNSLEMLY